MRIIDSKGRIFGKVNVIDFLFIIGIILVIIVASRVVFVQEHNDWRIVKVSSNNVPNYIFDNLNKGDAMNVNDDNMAVLLDIEHLHDSGAVAYFKVLAEKRKNKYFFDGSQLLIGDKFAFKSDKVIFTGTINSLSGLSEYNSRKKTHNTLIRVMLKKKEQWEADNILVGDKERDADNSTIAEITGKVVKPYQVTVTSDNGNIFARDDPLLIDVILDLRVDAESEDGKLFFKGTELKIGNSIALSTDSISLSGIIIHVE